MAATPDQLSASIISECSDMSTQLFLGNCSSPPLRGDVSRGARGQLLSFDKLRRFSHLPVNRSRNNIRQNRWDSHYRHNRHSRLQAGTVAEPSTIDSICPVEPLESPK